MLMQIAPSASVACPSNSLSASKISRAGTGTLLGLWIWILTPKTKVSAEVGGGEPRIAAQPSRTMTSSITTGQ